MLMGRKDEAEKDFSRALIQNPEYNALVDKRREEAKQQRERSQ
jgi:hypothetical protein